MPNHIANRISGSGLDEIRKLLKGPEDIVDFNMVIPMPSGLQDATADMSADAARDVFRGVPHKTYHERQKIENYDDKTWANFIRCLNNIRETGHATWYEWSIANWGTKWNAYSVEDRGDSLRFETAWGMPTEVLTAVLSALQEKEIDFIWEWADEDYGNNLGIVTIVNGFVASKNISPTIDPTAWAMRLHGHDDEEIADIRAEELAADEAAT